MANRILRHLYEHLVAWLESELDATSLALAIGGVLCRGLPVDLTGVQNGVASASDVDEGSLHARQYVLHATEVDISDQAGIRGLGHVMLDEHSIFEHPDLDTVELGANDHFAVDTLAAGEKFGLGDHRAAAACVASITAALLLRLKTGGSAHLRRLVAQLGCGAWRAYLDDGVGRVAVVRVRGARVAVFVASATA